MKALSHSRSVAGWLAAAIGIAAGAYTTYVGVTWCKYGDAPVPANPEEEDELLERFMPRYEAVERHYVRVAAPAALTLSTARGMDVLRAYVVRVIFKARELLLGATPDDRLRPSGPSSVPRMGGARRNPRTRAHRRCGNEAMGGECYFPGRATRRVRDVSRTRLREDRLDAARRPDRCDSLDLPHPNAGHDH